MYLFLSPSVELSLELEQYSFSEGFEVLTGIILELPRASTERLGDTLSRTTLANLWNSKLPLEVGERKMQPFSILKSYHLPSPVVSEDK